MRPAVGASIPLGPATQSHESTREITGCVTPDFTFEARCSGSRQEPNLDSSHVEPVAHMAWMTWRYLRMILLIALTITACESEKSYTPRADEPMVDIQCGHLACEKNACFDADDLESCFGTNFEADIEAMDSNYLGDCTSGSCGTGECLVHFDEKRIRR